MDIDGSASAKEFSWDIFYDHGSNGDTLPYNLINVARQRSKIYDVYFLQNFGSKQGQFIAFIELLILTLFYFVYIIDACLSRSVHSETYCGKLTECRDFFSMVRILVFSRFDGLK